MHNTATRHLPLIAATLLAGVAARCSQLQPTAHESAAPAAPTALAVNRTPVDQILWAQVNATTWASQPLPGSNTQLITMSGHDQVHLVVQRDKLVPEASYEMYAGSLPSADLNSKWALAIDQCDLDLPANQGMASTKLIAGWVVFVRSTGFPPVRTVRVTTGRPMLLPDLEAQEPNQPEFNPSRLRNQQRALADTPPLPSNAYSLLAAIEPGAKAHSGKEYFFVINLPQGATITLRRIADDGSLVAGEEVVLKDSQYVCYNRAQYEKGWSTPTSLPSLAELADLTKHPPFVKDAVCASYNYAKKQFFTGPADDCK